jgi:hypothetical protein
MAGMMVDQIDSWTRASFSVVFGIGCMLIGVLFIAGLAAGAPLAKLNLFWNLGLISFGFILLDHR